MADTEEGLIPPSPPSYPSQQNASDVTDILTFRETFNFRNFVTSHMLIEDTKEANDLLSRSARIVGQESDGTMILVWDSPLKSGSKNPNGASTVVTHFGAYHPLSPSYRTIYSHENQINVVGATVDRYQSLLAFTVSQEMTASGDVSYDTFIAEINPCNRVFSLNISSPDIRKVQFVHSSGSSSTSSASSSGSSNVFSRKGIKKSLLLVIIPDNWVCSYTFQLEPTHRGTMVMDQPIIDTIVKSISWYQWNPKLQWLCYARFSAAPTQVKRGAAKGSDSSVILHVLSFHGDEHKTLLTVALPIPLNYTQYSSTSACGLNSFFPSPLGFTLPAKKLNMKVLHNHEGVWCVCLQHKYGTPKSRTSSHSKENHTQSLGEMKLEYSVYLLHNGHVIDGEVLLSEPPSNTTEGHFIQFFLLGNFVIAYVPNVMLHVLNIGVNIDPCHHVVLQGNHAPSLPIEDHYEMDKRILTTAVTDNRISSDVSTALFDPQSQIFYSCRLESRGLLKVFKSTHDIELKLSLLHVTIVSLREYSIAIEMIESVCQSLYCMETYRLFEEFIIALTYANVPPDCPRLVTRHLPLTTAHTFHGNIYKNFDGSKYSILRCSELPNFVKQLLVQSDQKFVTPTSDMLFEYSRTTTDSLGHLCFNAVLSQPSIYKRLSLEDISAQVKILAQSTPSLTSSTLNNTGSKGKSSTGSGATTGGGTSFKKNISSSNKTSTNDPHKFNRSSNFVGKLKDLINSPKLGHRQEIQRFGSACLPFLLPDEDMAEPLKLRLNLLRDRLFQVMTTTLGLRSRNATSAVISKCGVYWLELQVSSRILLHLIWSSLKFTNENHPLSMSIHRQPSIDEVALFELLESYHAAHDSLGLSTPLGFDSLFVSMGYMCLEPSVFVQYLRHNVFCPTRKFLQVLFSDWTDVDEMFLFELISNLDGDSQEIALELWKHPHIVRMTSIASNSSLPYSVQK